MSSDRRRGPARAVPGRPTTDPSNGRRRAVADYLGKPTADGGAGWGSVQVSLGLAALIVGCVAYLATTRGDVQPQAAEPVPSPA
jgi:hypothetical protein